MAQKIKFYAAKAGFIEGIHHAKDAEILLTEKQAKYYLIAGNISRSKSVAKTVKAVAKEEPKKMAPAKAPKEDKGE
jgi:hypothetical protein